MVTAIFGIVGLALLFIMGFGALFKIDTKHARAAVLLYSVAMVCCAMGLAYLSAPYAGSDLSRYYYELSAYRLIGWKYSSQSLYSTTPLTCFFMYLVAQTGDFQLFPCISAGIAVSAWMLVINDHVRTYGLSTRVFFFEVASALAVNQILSLLIGGRQHLAICLLLAAVWYDLKPRGKNNKNLVLAIILYAFPLLIHYGVVAIYLARLLLFFMKDRSSSIVAAVSVVVALLSGAVLTFLDSSGIGGEYISQVAAKFFGYEEISVADDRLMALSVATVLAFFAMTFLCHCQARRKGSAGDYLTMMLISLSVAVAFVTNYHLSERVLAFCLYGFYPILLWVAQRRHDDKIVFFSICWYLLYGDPSRVLPVRFHNKPVGP